MFNGIIYNQGKLVSLTKKKNYFDITIISKLKVSKREIGSSISCNGVCLTLVSIKKNKLYFFLSKETLNKSNFNKIKIGDLINLEKSLSFGDKVSGHYVQGHVDTTGIIKKLDIIGKSWLLKININRKYINYLIEKGSISINGVSLTINKIMKNNFEILIIPHTLKNTNLIYLKSGDLVNIELDILSKYIKKISF